MVQLLRKKMIDVAANLKLVQENVSKACSKRPPDLSQGVPRLVAVSKTKPANLILDAYAAGQKHFGENYVNELVEKAFHPDIKTKDIRWHFIGHLQSNKVNKVVAIPNLYAVETVDTEKLASALNTAWQKHHPLEDAKLNVMVQVNTSGEEEKSGCGVAEASKLVRHVRENCKNLNFMGIMTIGAYGYDPTTAGPNPDFILLRKCRENVCKELELPINEVELSMGMSTDYEHAIELGSTNIRVGSAIFGERPPKSS